MTPEDRQFLKDAFQAVVDTPLEANDPRYVSLSETRGEDVVELLARGIEFSGGESVQFVCGLPGTGVTTELKRLGTRLAANGRQVTHWRPLTYSSSLSHWSEYFVDSKKQPTGSIVVVDSSFHLDVFSQHYRQLRAHGIHVVFVVPWVIRLDASTYIGLQRVGSIYELSTPLIRDIYGNFVQHGVDALMNTLRQRFDTQRLIGHEASLKKLIHASGGNPRDLLRLAQEVILRATSLPVEPSVVEAAISSQQNGRLPIPMEALPFLARIAETHEIRLDGESLEDVRRWAEAGLFLQYRNGREWYDIHPLVRDIVLEKARVAASASSPESPRMETPKPAPEAPLAPVALTRDMRVTLTVEHYRALRHVQWTLPRGVSALVGPNGSGKTTLLDILEFLRHALQHDVTRAIDVRGGPGNLRNAYADRDARVMLGVSLDSLGWQIDLSPKGAFTSPLVDERGVLGDKTIAFARSAPELLPTGDARTMLGRFSELREGAAFRPLVALLQGYRFYQSYDLASIRLNGSQMSADEYLHPDGRNVFSVLRNWRDRKETRPRWQFVIDSLKAAFPDTFDDLEFEMAGQTVSGRIVAPRPDVRMATYFAANGWLIALLHLTAVASTEPAGVVAIDEVENGLHPHAIRQIIEAMRDWAAQTGISIVLATHSPVVLDQFKSEPDHLFVMEPGRERTPMKLDELHDPEWLAHFSLGDLYAHDEFGAQHDRDEQSA